MTKQREKLGAAEGGRVGFLKDHQIQELPKAKTKRGIWMIEK